MTDYPEYVLDHFQNLNKSSLIHSLLIPQISEKSIHGF